jgi:hypothetical protein
MAWTIAALAAVATGCNGGAWRAEQVGSTDFDTAVNARVEDGVCDLCKATGGGVFLLDGVRVTFGLNAIPDDVTPGTGFGGEGFAAKGHVEIQIHDGANIYGSVDTILSCDMTEADGSATFAGELRDGGRFVVTVNDAGEPGRDDTISFTNDVSFGPVALEKGGNLQLHEFGRCEPPPQCPEGQCWISELEACGSCAPPPPPQCPEGQCWISELEVCGSCAPPPPPQCPTDQCWSETKQMCEPCFEPL